MKRLLALLLLVVTLTASGAVEDVGTHVRYSGTGTSDNDVLFTTGDVSRYDACVLMSTDGVVDVFVSLDGTNYSTAPLSLQDFGASTTDPVLVTIADRVYGFVGKYRKIRVLQNGATATAASMNCWAFGK